VASREIGLRDGLVLAPLVLCIVGLALYPQLILHRTDPAVQRSVAATKGAPPPQAQLASTGLKRPNGGRLSPVGGEGR
jgi:NADH:ubiquinone oxidoreductase subunit 4 (subunit M)